MQNTNAIFTAFEDLVKLVLTVIGSKKPVLKKNILGIQVVMKSLRKLLFSFLFNTEIINRHPPNATKLVSFPMLSEYD